MGSMWLQDAQCGISVVDRGRMCGCKRHSVGLVLLQEEEYGIGVVARGRIWDWCGC